MKKIILLLLLIPIIANAQYELEDTNLFFTQPISFEFTQNAIVVAEKKGKVIIVDLVNGIYTKRTDYLLDLTTEIYPFGEQGLLDIKIKDNKLYLYYTCRPEYFGLDNASISRVTKYDLDIPNNIVSNREVIIGQTLSDGIPILAGNHVGGSIDFLSDGTLIISTGDGANAFYESEAILNGIQDVEFAGFGMRAMQINSCNGKILRVDINGNGASDNPFYDAENPRKCVSRVYNLGLRNPFRARVKNDSIYINDVGSANWESIKISSGAEQNHGWAMREGFDTQVSGNEVNFETGLPFNETFDTEESGIWKWKKPLLAYHQDELIYKIDEDNEIQTLLQGNSISGNLPITSELYGIKDKFMFTDFFTGFICTVTTDAELDILNINQGGIVDIKEDLNGEIYFLSLYGQIYRLKNETLGINYLELSTSHIGEKYKVFDVTGKLIKQGVIDNYTSLDLKKIKGFNILVVENYKPLKIIN